MQKVSRDTPLNEITLRRYEKPSLKGRGLIRKFCLSVGLLQPGDSRDVVVDVLHVLLKEKKEMSSEEIREMVVNVRKEQNLALLGVASSNIRRQLKRLRDMLIVEKVANNYRIIENLNFSDIMAEKIEKLIIPSVLDRVREYFKAVGEEFSDNKK